MPIRRRSTPRPALRHVAFLETMASSAADAPRHHAAQAVFLALRLLDHRIAFGAQVTESASQSLATTRDEIARLALDDDLRAVLSTMTDAIAAIAPCPGSDALPALSPLFTLGTLLEARGHLAQAGDVFLTVARHTDADAHLDLAYESQMRAGACLRRAGEHDWADTAHVRAAQLATRARDTTRVLLAKLGRAKVLWARGDLLAADAAIIDLITDAEAAQSLAVTSRLLHERATLAWVRGECETAIGCAFRAFDLAPPGEDRAAILTALAAYLEALDAPDAAQVARGTIGLQRLASTRPVPRSAASARATSLELAREIARALRERGAELVPT